MNLIHCVWVDDADLDLIASSGAVVAHNPGCNLRLGSGIMPFRDMFDRGIPVCLGTDEMAADDGANLWLTARLTGLIHNLSHADYEKWPKANEVLDCLFAGGARAMLESDNIGSIEVGRCADIALLDLDTLPFTPRNDICRQLVYCEIGSSVRLSMVAGKIVYENGKVTTVDEAALRAEARELFAERQIALRAAARDADVWLPYYREMYLKACRKDVGLNRWAGSAFRI
jgi:5-methylthioadenosine/S-adenosylhomocysteine deaminase